MTAVLHQLPAGQPAFVGRVLSLTTSLCPHGQIPGAKALECAAVLGHPPCPVPLCLQHLVLVWVPGSGLLSSAIQLDSHNLHQQLSCICFRFGFIGNFQCIYGFYRSSVTR